ncbi:hypothetical protein G3489_19585 [Shewanella baltica]|uniref:DNA topoisomerase n=1 Tax=Shewanella baltica TaxID=62322 RepID=UPI00217EC83F|nr:DNA topoisomerase [Shewanella baltica]MCS6271880.1 hypothetical protein [Shewanella baltica]
MKLYLCEKPSQGEDVAKFLGMSPVHKKQGYFQKDDVIVTWARGHLFKLQPPEYYTPELKGKWAFDKLPVIPEKFEYALDPKSKPQFRVIKTLLRNVKDVFIATDPDPEGECIARNILRFASFKGNIFRVLYGATDKKTLTRAFAKPLPSSETEWMFDVALARAQSDWVVGMNLTMAMTLLVQRLESSDRLKKSFPIGRVKTPAAMLVFIREQAIKAFKPIKYYQVEVDVFTQEKAEFTLTWNIPERVLSDGRLLDQSYALKAVQYFQQQKIGIIEGLSVEDKAKQPPLPYELTTLQSACDKYEISPDETLEIAQSLYDKPLSSTSYPRTNIGYLPEGLLEDVNETIENLLKIEPFKALKEHLDTAKKSKAWNDKKVKVHHGIIPTTSIINFSRLTPKQKAVYVLIAKRYLVQFMSDYLYEHTSLTVKIGNLTCTANCNISKKLGWRAIEESEDDTDSVVSIPQVFLGQKLGVKNARVLEKTTRQPSRYNQASLAKAMENVSAEIEDPALKKLLSDNDGIGTVATRGKIIKDLIASGLLVEDKRQLKPSRWFEKNMSHIPEQMKQPANTALWERGFHAIRDGQISKDKFVDFQTKFVKSAVAELEKTFSEVK